MNKYFFKKKTLSTILMSFLLLSVFLTILPQTQAAKPSLSVTLTSPNPVAYISGSGIAGGMYGATVAFEGNYIFVSGEGNFYVYNAKAQVLVNTIAGSTIAIGGGYVAIGNPSYSSTSCKVDIYRLNNLRKVVATLTSPEASHVGFGLSMAISSGKMLISDVGTNSGEQPYSGDVYVFSIPSFTYLAKLEQTNPERAYGSPFGDSVAFCGNYIVVGAPDQTVNGVIFCGNVYLYNSETYAFERTIPNPDAMSWGMFGSSITVADNNIWISEPGFTYPDLAPAGETSFTGKVYCYNSNGEQVTSLSSKKPTYGGFFGRSIAVNDAYVFVGAPGESAEVASGIESTIIPYAGQVYLFTKSGTYIKTLISPNPQIFGLFGSSVAFGCGYYIVGAPEENATLRYRSTIKTYNDAGLTHIMS